MIEYIALPVVTGKIELDCPRGARRWKDPISARCQTCATTILQRMERREDGWDMPSIYLPCLVGKRRKNGSAVHPLTAANWACFTSPSMGEEAIPPLSWLACDA